MSDELKKKVARLFCDTAAGQCGNDFFCEQCLGGADAAIALALEKAAQAAESIQTVEIDGYDFQVDGPSQHTIADAIRALKGAP